MAAAGPAIEDVEKKWDLFSDWFEQDMAYVCLSIAVSLQLASGARLGGKVLEIGCGAGQASYVLAQCLSSSTQKPIKLTAIDLAPKMVALAAARLSGLPAVEEVAVGNAEKLTFADGSFDRVYSNLCLQITPDPDAMLRECARVLVSAGQAAFSVWGTPENSRMMEIVPEVMFETGAIQEMPKTRRAYHLGGDLEALRSRVLAAGFSHCQCWRQTAEAFVANFCMPPTSKKHLASLSEEKAQEFKALMAKKANEALDAGTVLALEVVIIHARK